MNHGALFGNLFAQAIGIASPVKHVEYGLSVRSLLGVDLIGVALTEQFVMCGSHCLGLGVEVGSYIHFPSEADLALI